MSRQNKQAKKKQLAKQFTAIHKSGGKGPAKTQPAKKTSQHKNKNQYTDG